MGPVAVPWRRGHQHHGLCEALLVLPCPNRVTLQAMLQTRLYSAAPDYSVNLTSYRPCGCSCFRQLPHGQLDLINFIADHVSNQPRSIAKPYQSPVCTIHDRFVSFGLMLAMHQHGVHASADQSINQSLIPDHSYFVRCQRRFPAWRPYKEHRRVIAAVLAPTQDIPAIRCDTCTATCRAHSGAKWS